MITTSIKQLTLISACFLLFAAASAQQADSTLVLKDSVRGKRYCELVVVKGPITNLSAYIYNTLGCDSCSPDKWKILDSATSITKLQKEQSAHAVIANGPRYYLMDKIGVPTDTTLFTFDSIQMKPWPKLHITMAMAMASRKNEPYKERGIKYSSQAVFNKGSQVYEIVSPQHTYIMESYSQTVDSSLTEAALPNLGQRLRLPDGWQYKAITLDADLILTTTDAKESFGFGDEFENRYRRIEPQP